MTPTHTVRPARWRCRTCSRIHKDADLLHAPSPFDSRDILFGCPWCKVVGDFERVCDEPDCKMPCTSGWLTKDGKEYRHTCYAHSAIAKEVGYKEL